MNTLDEIREFFKKDRFATENGMVIDEVGEGYAKCSLTICDRHKNAVGGVMGGVPFTLADFCYAVASNWKEPKWVSLSSQIAFLGTAKGQRLIAVANMIKSGRSTNYYEIRITDELENLVANVTITGFSKQ
ncbi:MAG: PaaI family thioesterase [Clostridia bacterium]|nr:PaaI family thioesterase [Clostridia bacterium]